jgi:predicted metal-binding membrane protein
VSERRTSTGSRSSPASPGAARRDRGVLLAGLVGISALAWGYTIALADHAAHADAAEALLHLHARPWTAAELGTTFAMWVVMMVAMMAPTVAPMLLALDRIGRARPGAGGSLLPATAFLAGYLLVWTALSLVAALVQWRLHELALVSAAGASRGTVFSGLLLLLAGAFQLTPQKQACLRRCRSPLLFLMSWWRPGAWGALRMGILHGVFCVGCCWALMALMLVGGAMNLLWAAALMLLMLAEKALPIGRRVAHAAGVGLIGWGTVLLATDLRWS